MRVILVALLGLLLAAPAGAGMVDKAMTGANGMLTAPVDPVMGLLEGHDNPVPVLGNLPLLGTALDHATGLVHGTVVGVLRLGLGALDLATAPLPLPALSPAPRVALLPGVAAEGPPPGFPR